MHGAALRVGDGQSTKTYPQQQLDEFVQELTGLCQKYGLGIGGSPTLFVMEPVDTNLAYAVDEESNLVLT